MGVDVEELDNVVSVSLDHHVWKLTILLQKHWDLTNLIRRHDVSQRNRDRTATAATPNINVGDHVLCAVHKPDTKLDYTWLGPAVITGKVTPLVYTIQPYTTYVVKLVRPISATFHKLQDFSQPVIEDQR